MDDLRAAMDAVRTKVDFLRKAGPTEHHICVSVAGLAGEKGISPESVERALGAFTALNILSLSTWRWDAFREVSYREWGSTDFFYNPHDSGYVRLRLVR